MLSGRAPNIMRQSTMFRIVKYHSTISSPASLRPSFSSAEGLLLKPAFSSPALTTKMHVYGGPSMMSLLAHDENKSTFTPLLLGAVAVGSLISIWDGQTCECAPMDPELKERLLLKYARTTGVHKQGRSTSTQMECKIAYSGDADIVDIDSKTSYGVSGQSAVIGKLLSRTIVHTSTDVDGLKRLVDEHMRSCKCTPDSIIGNKYCAGFFFPTEDELWEYHARETREALLLRAYCPPGTPNFQRVPGYANISFNKKTPIAPFSFNIHLSRDPEETKCYTGDEGDAGRLCTFYFRTLAAAAEYRDAWFDDYEVTTGHWPEGKDRQWIHPTRRRELLAVTKADDDACHALAHARRSSSKHSESILRALMAKASRADNNNERLSTTEVIAAAALRDPDMTPWQMTDGRPDRFRGVVSSALWAKQRSAVRSHLATDARRALKPTCQLSNEGRVIGTYLHKTHSTHQSHRLPPLFPLP
jgi:hypothetical protein